MPAPPTVSSSSPSPWRPTGIVRSGFLVLAISAGIALLTGADNPRDLPAAMTVSGVCGLAIYATAWLLLLRLHRRIESLAELPRFLAYSAVFLTSGAVAWALAAAVARLVFGQRTGGTSLAIVVGLALAFGFTFRGFHRLRERLETSVARLKEVEFAEKELQLARALQSRLLPPPEIAGEGYRVGARNLAARVVAGDFYDVFPLADGAIGLVVADVAGKGMAAALVMASVKAMLPLIAAGRTAEETLRELNRRLAAELSAREFVALAYARYEPLRGRLTLANAGLPDPYLLAATGSPTALAVPGPRLPLGVRKEVDYRALDVPLAAGDRLLLLTDGLAEAPVPGGEPLGYARLAELLSDGASGTSPLAWIDGLLERVRQATGPWLEDDWTALVVERTAE